MNLKCEFSLQFFLMKLNQLMFSFHPFNSNFSYTHVQFSMSRDDATILYSFSINSYHWLHLFFWMVLSRVWRCIMTTSHCRCFHISLHLSGGQRNITIEKKFALYTTVCLQSISPSSFVNLPAGLSCVDYILSVLICMLFRTKTKSLLKFWWM